ncbi:MAG: hypothetical protein KA953_00690 [Lachnospiraceae bacterium]|nr:hypothetical protein [Lachnospiraceae bacterium]
MTRYINANKFRDYLVTARDKRIDNPLYEEELNNLNYAITQLDNQPSADVQPVVHCKDCKFFWSTEYGPKCFNDFWNLIQAIKVLPDDYCSHGEKGDDDDHD